MILEYDSEWYVVMGEHVKLRILLIESMLQDTSKLFNYIDYAPIRLQLVVNLAHIVQLVLQLRYDEDNLGTLFSKLKNDEATKSLFNKYINILTRLKTLRNKSIHEGIIPSVEDAQEQITEIPRFISEFIMLTFGEDYQKLKYSDLVKQNEVQKMLREAEEYMEEGKYFKAALLLDKAIEYIIKSVAKDSPGVSDNTTTILEKLKQLYSNRRITEEIYDILVSILNEISSLADSVDNALYELKRDLILLPSLREGYLEHKEILSKYKVEYCKYFDEGKKSPLYLAFGGEYDYDKLCREMSEKLKNDIWRSYLFAIKLALIFQEIIIKMNKIAFVER